MVALQIDHHFRRRALAAALLLSSLFGMAVSQSTSVASASTVVPTCSSSQLAVAVASSSGGYAAAGNEGIPFIIVNISKSTCSLKGYPRLTTYPSTYKNKTVKVVDGGGMIFVPVKPRRVAIMPGATASFGLDYGDAYDQQDPNAGPCMTKSMTVTLPTRSHPFAQPFNTTVNINFCYAGFHFAITSIQSGPIARIG